MVSKLSVLSLSLFLSLAACSSPPVAPHRVGGKSSGASTENPTSKPGSTTGTGDTEGTTSSGSPTISKAGIKEVADEVLAFTSDRCVGGVDKEATSKEVRSTLRLLTREEYKNSVQDILGLKKNFAEGLSPEHKILGFSNNSKINIVGDGEMSSFLNTARDVAKTALSDSASTLPCRSGDGCAEKILTAIGPQAWRRPMEADEKSRLLSLYQMASADGANIGLEVMITALFSSPHFLYRSEVGKDGQLTAFETASALSYFFWSTTPDAELRKLAENGTITDPKVMAAQALRLMSNARAKAGSDAFSEALLEYSKVVGITKNTSKYKTFTPAVSAALKTEASDTLDFWIRSKNYKFADLFSSQVTVGDEALAGFYGAKTSQDGNVKVINFSDSKRRGILGLGGILAQLATADETHPIRRGIYVREQLLCETIAPTPTGLIVAIPPIKEGSTTRERFAAHTSNPACASCHSLIDGVGFGMEDYDSIGQYREMDNNLPVDASGNFTSLDGKDQPFTGIDGINSLLKTSDRAKRCFVLQVFRQAAGRLESKSDVCDIRKVADDFISKDKPLNQVFLNIITSSAYLAREAK